jgi:hypothetical protein
LATAPTGRRDKLPPRCVLTLEPVTAGFAKIRRHLYRLGILMPPQFALGAPPRATGDSFAVVRQPTSGDQVTERDRPGSGRITTVALSSLLAILLIGMGTFQLWFQHSGTPAHVTVVSCGPPAPHYRTHNWLTRIWRQFHKEPESCVGQPSGAPGQQSIEIYGAQYADVGHVIDVHLTDHGKSAHKDKWWGPLIEIGIGCLIAVGGIWVILPNRRHVP